jgi:hypothetical protein
VTGLGSCARCTGAWGRVGWGFGGVGAALHGGSITASWRRSGGGGWRKEKGPFTGSGSLYSG